MQDLRGHSWEGAKGDTCAMFGSCRPGLSDGEPPIRADLQQYCRLQMDVDLALMHTRTQGSHTDRNEDES